MHKEKERDFILLTQLIKRLLLAWDPDYTKVTPEEKARIDKADEEIKRGYYFTEEEVWN